MVFLAEASYYRTYFLAADLFPNTRLKDFADILLSSRTRELVRSRTAATKASEIKQIKKGADLLDSTTFRIENSLVDSIASQDSTATSSTRSNTSESEALCSDRSGLAANHVNFNTPERHSSTRDGIRGSCFHSNISSTPFVQETFAEQPGFVSVVQRQVNEQPFAACEDHAHCSEPARTCTCAVTGSTFVTQAARCLDDALCQHCS